jgi:hypothetical protein
MPIFAALAGLSAASKLSIAGSVVNGLLSYKSAQQQRKQAIADQDNQYVRMRNAAQRAGFNPLTVMRATGGQGFTGLPTISKAAAFGNAAAGIFDAVQRAPIDKYNEEVRDLEKKQRKADLELMPMRGKLMKAQIDNITGKTDPYVGYGNYIPVKNGVNIQELDITVAKRLGIKPNDRLTGGDLEEILGELHGNFQAGVGSKTGTEALRPYYDPAGIIVKELPPVARNKSDQQFVDYIWNGIEQALPTGILSTPGIFSGKTPSEKWPFNKF